MNLPAKMLAAGAALRNAYADIQQRRLGKKFTAKMRAAAIALAERYDAVRTKVHGSRQYDALTAVCKIDRVVLTTSTASWYAIRRIAGYRPTPPRRLWNKDYGFAQCIKGTGSIGEVVVEYKRTAPWFPQVRIAIIPRDETGLLSSDLRLLLESLPGAQLNIVEIAWDFPSGCIVDRDYVRRFGLFGNTWLRPGSNPYHNKWGSVGSKIVRAYFKWELFQFRIELELHRQFLQENGIADVFDFRKLVTALVPDHIDFAQFDEAKLVRALQRKGLPLKQEQEVLKRVKQKAERSLWEALWYLHQAAGLANTDRLLVAVPEMNRVVRDALEKLAAQWPVRPKKTGRKP
jgi:hypothetical protein